MVIFTSFLNNLLGNVLLKEKQLQPKEADLLMQTFYYLPITFTTESEDLAKETFQTLLHLV